MRHKICFLDLDGTVNSSSSVRDHLIPTQPMYEENWAAWHAAHVNEKPNYAIIEVVRALAAAGWKIVVLSIRGDHCQKSSAEQLEKWQVPHCSRIFKSPGDSRQPALFKTDEIKSAICWAKNLGQEVDVLVIDDSKDICEAANNLRFIVGGRINVMQVEPFKG